MGSKHPTFQAGDAVIPSVRARAEKRYEPGIYVVVEILRGPGMMIRPAARRRPFKAMRKHFELFFPVEERVAAALMWG